MHEFRAPDLFETEEVELEWLYTRALPLREALVGLSGASQQQVVELKALTSLMEPEPDLYWPGTDPPSHPEVAAQQAEETNWLENKAQIWREQIDTVQRARQRRWNLQTAKANAYQESNDAANKKRRREREELDDQTRRTRMKLEQGIRDAQTQYFQTQATTTTQQQDNATQEQYRKLVLEEAATLTRLLGLGTSITNKAQVNAVVDIRRKQRAQQVASKATKLKNGNLARYQAGLQAIKPEPQLSASEFDVVLNDAAAYLNPTRVATEAAAAKAAEDAAAKKNQADIFARALKDFQERQLAGINAPSTPTGPAKQADIDREERRKRYQAPYFRQIVQDFADAEDRKRVEEQKRQDNAEAQRKDAERQQRAEAATRREAAAKAAALASANKTAAQIKADADLAVAKQKQNDIAVLQQNLQDSADKERAQRGNRVPLTTPGVMNPTERKIYDDAVAKRDKEVKIMTDYIRDAATGSNTTEDEWVRVTHGYRDVADYIEMFDYNDIIRRAMPGAVNIPLPRKNLTPSSGDSPPPNTPRPPNLNTDPPKPGPLGGPPNVEPWKSVETNRNDVAAAVRGGLEARAKVLGISIWQAAHLRGWWSLDAMTNHYVNLLPPPYTGKKTEEVESYYKTVHRIIYDANDWEAQWLVSEMADPSGPYFEV